MIILINCRFPPLPPKGSAPCARGGPVNQEALTFRNLLAQAGLPGNRDRDGNQADIKWYVWGERYLLWLYPACVRVSANLSLLSPPPVTADAWLLGINWDAHLSVGMQLTLSLHNSQTAQQAATLESLINQPSVTLLFFGEDILLKANPEESGQKKQNKQQQQKKIWPHLHKWFPARCIAAAAGRAREKILPSSQIGSVVLIETRCCMVSVCYCKLLPLPHTTLTWRLISKLLHAGRVCRIKYVALKACVSVKVDAFLSCRGVSAV